MSCTLSTNSGSVESLNVSLRCGFRLNADQIRCTVMCERPVLSAMLRVDQCVASFGIVVSVRLTTSATLSSVTVRGRPDRYSSERPSMRFSANRLRHLPTVCSCTLVRSANSLFRSPSAQRRMILQRSDSDLGALCFQTCASRNARSSSFSTTSTASPLIEPPPAGVIRRLVSNYRYRRLGSFLQLSHRLRF